MNKVAKVCVLLLATTTHSVAQFPDQPSPASVTATKPRAAKDDEFLSVFDDPSDFPSDSPSLAIAELDSSDQPSDQPSGSPSSSPALVRKDSKSDYPSTFVSDQPSDSPSTSPSFGLGFSAASVNASSNFLSNLLDENELSSDTPSIAAFSQYPSDVPSQMPSDVPSLASDTPTTVDPLLPEGAVNNYTICGAWNASTLEQAKETHSKYVYTLQLGVPQMDALNTIHSVEKLIENELVEKMCGLFTFALAVEATPDDFATGKFVQQ